ncbi:MAG: hypothetical protein R2758_11090 [Bacteroidales bacterium]
MPWHNRVILGTTDIPVKEFVLEPKALDEEVDFILETAGRYLEKKPQRSDVLCVFAGLRPLAAPKHESEDAKTKEISRSHKLLVSPRQGSLLSPAANGPHTGRWLRILINAGIRGKEAPFRPCRTKDIKIHGYLENPDRDDRMYIYGSVTSGK